MNIISFSYDDWHADVFYVYAYSSFSFFTAWHLVSVYLLMSSFTRERISLLGLKVGTNRSGR